MSKGGMAKSSGSGTTPATAENSGGNSGGRGSRGRFRPGNRHQFHPGTSGNAGGRPKGSKTFSVLLLVQEALARPGVKAALVKVLADRLKAEARREDLEFMARLTRETGVESAVMPSLTINIHTNVDPSTL